MSSEFYWVAVIATTIISAARLTRLAVIDKFPPIKWLRDKYEERADGTGWDILTMCGYCMAPYMSALVILTGLFAGVYHSRSTLDVWQGMWWGFNGTFAVAYLAAIIMAHDGDDD